MKQILHIFTKDVRRFWPEILASLAILTALVCVYPRRFPEVLHIPVGQPYLNMWEYSNLLFVLAMVSWCLLIARLIHAEGLVGDRQYWLTRPYTWPSLLAAKLLFLVAFLYLPLAVTQTLILAASGLNPMAALPGLFYNLLLLTGVIVLPLVAIATVTPDFIRMALTLVAVLAGMVPYIVLNQHIGIDDALSPAHLLPSNNQPSSALLLGCFSGAAILLQYARRRTWMSLLLCVPALLAVGILLKPLTARFDQGRIDRVFPPLAAGEAAPLQIVIPPNAFSAANRWTPTSDMANVFIRLTISGIPENKGVLIDAPARVTLIAPDGFQWSGEVFEWSWGKKEFATASKHSAIDVNMPVSTYARLQTKPVTLRFTLPLTLLHAEKTARVPISLQRFAIPGEGDCQAISSRPGQKFSGRALFDCRSAFRKPQITQISADWSDAPCRAEQTELDYVGGPEWMGLSDSEPAEFGIDPVKGSFIGLGTSYREHTGKHLCSGHSLTLTQYQPERRMQATLTVENVQLAALR